ncbi:MAG: helix-turn-helix domain-containing protein [Nitrospinae bacterium]|nr:helix-turn-helix domain-containing protein [Nitrospinota bacterium]
MEKIQIVPAEKNSSGGEINQPGRQDRDGGKNQAAGKRKFVDFFHEDECLARHGRSLSPKTQEAIRIKAVKAVMGGKTQVEVAQIFGVTRQALGKWIAPRRIQQALKK